MTTAKRPLTFALCAVAAASASFLLPQAAQAADDSGFSKTKIFTATSISTDSDKARQDAIAAAEKKMEQYSTAPRRYCSLQEQNVKFEGILKRIPPEYLWKATLTYHCSPPQ